LQPLSTGSVLPAMVKQGLKRWKRGSEKRIKKLDKSFGSLEKTITFAAAKTKTSSLKHWEEEKRGLPGRTKR
jgi:hypothetical protein